jgi:hypothetical protein
MRALWFGLALALAAGVPEVAWAGGRGSGESRPASGRARITVNVVHATDSESGVDPRLSSFASQFKYLKYRGYRLLSTESADLSAGAEKEFSIDGGRTLTVSLVSKDDAHARVRVEIEGARGKFIDTTVKINRDGTFIVAGPKYKDGILILPLRASY